jgi:hypothetical protein
MPWLQWLWRRSGDQIDQADKGRLTMDNQGVKEFTQQVDVDDSL